MARRKSIGDGQDRESSVGPQAPAKPGGGGTWLTVEALLAKV